MNAKNTKNSPIHENADENITCDFGDGDISRFRSRLPHGHTVSSIIVRFSLLQGTLTENGSLAEDQKAALFEELANRENTMRAEVEAKRSQQLAAVKSRLAAQRARQMEELRERQERDKMEVRLYRSHRGRHFLVLYRGVISHRTQISITILPKSFNPKFCSLDYQMCQCLSA